MEQPTKGLQEYIDIALRRKWILIVSAVIGTAVGAFYASALPNYYSSSTLILIERQQISESYIKPTDRTPLSSRLNTLSQQIMSRTKLEKIAAQFNLFDRAAPSIWFIDKGREWLGLSTKGPRTKRSVIDEIKNNIEVKVIANGTVRTAGYRDPDAFVIKYTDTDPIIAMKVTEKLASMFIEENVRIRERYAEETTKFLDSELQRAKKELEKQERTLKEFKEKHMGALPDQLDANLRTLDRLQLELQTLNGEISNTESKIELLEGQLDQEGAKAPTDVLEQEIVKLRKELVRLRAIYSEDYPDVKLAKKRLAELENKFKKMSEETRKDDEAALIVNADILKKIKGAKNKLKGLEERKTELIRQIRKYERRVEMTPSNEQRLADIKRGYDISLQNYRTLLEKKLDARLAENLEKKRKGERFRIIDPANLPRYPVSPDRTKITFQGSAAGLIFGILLVSLIEFMNPAFTKAEELADAFSIPVLATIPVMSKVHRIESRRPSPEEKALKKSKAR